MKHTNEELIEIYSKLQGDAIYSEYFIKNYEISYGEFDEDQDWEDITESVEVHTLNYCLKDYLPHFLKCIQNGHGPVWSDIFAYNIDVDEVAKYTYDEIMKKNPELARAEIIIYCNSLGNDEIFKRYYLSLIENFCFRDFEHIAFEYSKIYTNHIAQGKSEIYAHRYAELKVNSTIFNEFHCDVYATTYYNSIEEGKSEEYANLYANELLTFTADNYSNPSQMKEDLSYEYFHEKILWKMREWESKLENNNR